MRKSGRRSRRRKGVFWNGISRREQERQTSDALSREMLYLKFVQGMPVVGVVGGVSDMVYQKKISDYAALKYKRRFLEQRRQGDQI